MDKLSSDGAGNTVLSKAECYPTIQELTGVAESTLIRVILM
jgi:hypothetical protein